MLAGLAGLLLLAAALPAQEASSAIEDSDEILGVRKPAPVQVAGRLAIVDVPAVWLLHPSMREYVFDEASFARPLPDGTPADMRPLVLKRRLDEARRKMNEVESLRARLAQEDRALQSDEYTLTGELNERQAKLREEFRVQMQKAPGTRAAKEPVFAKAMQDAEEAFWGKKKAITEKLEENGRTLRAKLAEVRGIGFLSPEERDKRFAEMAAEIREAIAAETARGPFTAVLNKGYLAERLPAAETAPQSYMPREVEAYANAYHDFLTAKPDAGNPQSPELTANRARQWLSNRARVAGGVPGAAGLFAFVVQGGEDVTAAVTRRILVRHKVPAARIAVLLRVLSEP